MVKRPSELLSEFGSESSDGVPETKERTMAVVRSTEGLGVTGAGVKVCEDTECKKQPAASTGQGIMRILACWDVI